ncbi:MULTISPECIES: hypothetical protein [Enterococcus]|uniref:Uncharacterized protein n=1 Tax=Candidatus Enterococcus murrayae TaxID=2815321 RepID=A0ABS3HKA9_9ENTE|nr:hypothetical protein [Enterococcus sp. MJM16]MBO0453891.1 hypothetical protein [Enterococcus sp. MJM16]
MTIVESDLLKVGFALEAILLITLILILQFIVTSGRIRKDPFSKKGKSKFSLYLAAILIIVAMLLVFLGVIKGATWSF